MCQTHHHFHNEDNHVSTNKSRYSRNNREHFTGNFRPLPLSSYNLPRVNNLNTSRHASPSFSSSSDTGSLHGSMDLSPHNSMQRQHKAPMRIQMSTTSKRFHNDKHTHRMYNRNRSKSLLQSLSNTCWSSLALSWLWFTSFTS